jgi:hypothetical protein
MSDLDFSQGFTKSGQLISQYGGFEPSYEINKNEKLKQANNLFKYFADKYSKVSKILREKWRDEMFNMEGFEYMNIEFLAAALHLYENYYSEDEEISVVFRNVFKREDKMEFYYDLLIDRSNKKKITEDEYTEKKIVTKQLLYTYIIKVYYYRKEDEIIDSDNIKEYEQPLRSRDV